MHEKYFHLQKKEKKVCVILISVLGDRTLYNYDLTV